MPKPKPKVQPDAEVSTKPEVKADVGLGKLYKAYVGLADGAGNKFYEIVVYVKKNKLSREIVRKTLEEKGLAKSSVNSELSRIFGLKKDEHADALAALGRGEVTVAAARNAISTPQKNPRFQSSRDIEERVSERLDYAAKLAVKEKANYGGIGKFRDDAMASYRKADAEAAKKAEEAAKNGAEQPTEEEEEVSAQID
jgi:hypothetical protein